MGSRLTKKGRLLPATIVPLDRPLSVIGETWADTDSTVGSELLHISPGPTTDVL